MAKVTLFAALAALEKPKGIIGFPKVVVDQTNFRISDIIKRNLAGEQVMGNQNLSYDYQNGSKEYDPEKLNPFNDIGFDLDDVIRLAKSNGQQVTDLQNRLGELKQQLDQAKQLDQDNIDIKKPEAPKEEPKG